MQQTEKASENEKNRQGLKVKCVYVSHVLEKFVKLHVRQLETFVSENVLVVVDVFKPSRECA